MTNKRLIQGTLSTIAVGAVGAGMGFITQPDSGIEGLIRGIILIAIGSGIIFWREKRKGNGGDKL